MIPSGCRSLDTSDVVKTHAGLAEFTGELVVRGVSEDEILSVLGGNFVRVLMKFFSLKDNRIAADFYL